MGRRRRALPAESNSTYRPIAFEGRAIIETEIPTNRKERISHYLRVRALSSLPVRHIIILEMGTDHRPLEFVFKTKASG